MHEPPTKVAKTVGNFGGLTGLKVRCVEEAVSIIPAGANMDMIRERIRAFLRPNSTVSSGVTSLTSVPNSTVTSGGGGRSASAVSRTVSPSSPASPQSNISSSDSVSVVREILKARRRRYGLYASAVAAAKKRILKQNLSSKRQS